MNIDDRYKKIRAIVSRKNALTKQVDWQGLRGGLFEESEGVSHSIFPLYQGADSLSQHHSCR